MSFFHYHHYPYLPDSEGHTGSNSFYIKHVIEPWNESSITWNNQPAATEENKVTVPATTSPNQDFLDIDVTMLVKDMLSTGNANYGFSLSFVNETPYRYIGLASSDIDISDKRPKIEIKYSYFE